MKRKFTFMLMLILCTIGYGQVKDSTILFDRQLVNRLIKKEFANLINPQSNNIIGNFASLDLKDADVNLAGNIVFEDGSILGIKANGGTNDGFLSIFSNTKLNSKFGAEVQYSFLFYNKKTIQYFRPDYIKYKKQKDKIEQEY